MLTGCRERAFVAQLGERIGLVHELRELGGTKELAQGSDHRTNVDQRHRRQLLLVTNGHAFFDDALHTSQADAQLVLDQLTHRLDAAVAEVIDVIGVLDPVVNLDHTAQESDHIALRNSAMRGFSRVIQDRQARYKRWLLSLSGGHRHLKLPSI